MKQVLIIDGSPLFREFLKEKLSAENVAVESADGRRDALTKLLSTLPDLIILDIAESVSSMLEFLSKKAADINAKKIPIIISGPIISRSEVAPLIQYGVVKYFSKPIKFDVFFESIGKILHAAFSFDTTPCVLELHTNGSLIFIELAQRLNREKISLLKYKLMELIQANKITQPKIVLMMTDLTLSFTDGVNLEFLLDKILAADTRIQKRNIKILALDEFTRELISGHSEYAGIKVSDNLTKITNSLVEGSQGTPLQELISDKILTSSGKDNSGSVEMRFYSDAGPMAKDDKSNPATNGNTLQVAIVDDDVVIRRILEASYNSIGAKCDSFNSGSEFIANYNKKKYNLIVLDIFMPGLSGFDILKSLQERQNTTPIIIYSQLLQKEVVVQALSLGARTYLTKPQKPNVILQKSLELLNDNNGTK